MTVDNIWETMGTNVWMKRVLYPANVCAGYVLYAPVDESAQPIPCVVHAEHTSCPQLDIQFVLYLRDVFTNSHVEFDSFFDLFDRMNRCRMVFSA